MPLLRPLTGLLSLAAAHVHAHPGHGILQDAHWHASDAWGFVAIAALAAFALWLSGRK